MRERVYERNLVEYIKRNLRKGYTGESLKWALVSQGYTRMDVSQAIETASRELAAELPKVEAPKPTPRIEPVEEAPVKKGFFSRLFG